MSTNLRYLTRKRVTHHLAAMLAYDDVDARIYRHWLRARGRRFQRAVIRAEQRWHAQAPRRPQLRKIHTAHPRRWR